MAVTGTQIDTQAAGAIPVTPADQLSALWGRARVRWASLSTGQRNRTLAAVILLGAVLGGLAWMSLRTDWRTLYAGMEPDDARQTGMTLTQAQIPFDVAQDGTAILVPASQLDKARLATAAKGGVRSGRMGFELFDKPNWVGSEFDEQVNYQRAMEGELEHTVGTLADVESARVHLVLPHESLFREEERPAKASVVLKLRHGGLAEGEAESIRNLVASAVDGLAPDRVVLVDAAGHLPLGPKTPEALRLNAEQALEEKLIATMEPVIGSGNVRASVTLDFDPQATDETRETYDPSQSAALSMQRTQQTSGPQPVAAGIPGAASNAPNTQNLPVYPKQTTPAESSTTESGTYGVSKTVRHTVEDPGRLRRLTAAIVVNDKLIRPAGKGGAAQWQPWTQSDLRNLTALAQAAVGFDPARGDVVTVQDMAFEENRTLQPVPMPQRVLNAVAGEPLLIKYTALVAGLVIVVLLGVRPALRTAQAALQAGRTLGTGGPVHELHGRPVETGGLQPPAPAMSDPERLRSQEILEQVTGHLRREPAQSSRLLQSWIHSE
ncbi:MAG: flagellar M-ring protein FliF [Acidobacteriota bacterium]|nr:flagellar M-ring protein FliF [Acidobacteriota bacterium]